VTGRGRVAAVLLVGAALTACSTNTSTTAGSTTSTAVGAGRSSSAPGVTSTAINVGAISTLTGPIASNFESLVPGVKAYFDYVNAHGGVHGRKLVLARSLDDGGNPSQFNQLANTLINEDHVFAVVGVATAFFSPNPFLETGTPVYGYNVTGNWSPGQSLFAAGGSVQVYPNGEPAINWWAQQVHATNVGLVALGVSSSNSSCKAFGRGLAQAGIKVGYADYNVAYGGNLVPDVQRMQRAGVNAIITCMDVTDNISMARAVQQYGYTGVKQLWLNGDDQPTLNQYQSLMQNVWFSIDHVPFSYAKTAPSKYPGVTAYVGAMKKYEPQWVYDEVAIQGWESAALFAQGVKLAGNNLTQANVVAMTNKITNFTAGGLTAPVNWTQTHSDADITPPYCNAFIAVKGDSFVPAFDPNDRSFVCFGSNVAKPTLVSPPAGTPGT
jgi:ABC-type branched-subunit amino acid transport system substrate-binding protein